MANEMRSAAGRPAAQDSDQPDVELRMRRALGLEPTARDGAARRSGVAPVQHRDHRDHRAGEPGVNRVAVAESALAVERTAREQADATVRQLQAALREAETRHGHAELARDEAMQALAAERAAREAAEQQLRQLSSVAPPEPPEALEAPPRPARIARTPRPAASGDAEPVEWWVPGWKAKLTRKG